MTDRRAYHRAYRRSERYREWRAAWRSMRRALGLCIDCPNASELFLRCFDCRMRELTRKRMRGSTALNRCNVA